MAPDLRCTKMCPAMRKTGLCGDASCGFAHRREELRKVVLDSSATARRRGNSRQDQPDLEPPPGLLGAVDASWPESPLGHSPPFPGGAGPLFDPRSHPVGPSAGHDQPRYVYIGRLMEHASGESASGDETIAGIDTSDADAVRAPFGPRLGSALR